MELAKPHHTISIVYMATGFKPGKEMHQNNINLRDFTQCSISLKMLIID